MGCLRLLLSREERGASGCSSHPTGLLHRAPTLWVSTCGARECLTGSHAWSPGKETRDPGPEMIPGCLLSPSLCAAEPSPPFCPNLPRKTVLSASDSDSLSARVSLRLQSALPFLPEDVSSHGQHLSDLQKYEFIPCQFFISSWRIPILHRLLLGRVSGTE